MKGRRIYADDKGNLSLAEGDYGFAGLDGHGHWVVRPPGCHAGGIPDHEVVEHPDGTITVSPSIKLTDVKGDGSEVIIWHGYLRQGEWSTEADSTIQIPKNE